MLRKNLLTLALHSALAMAQTLSGTAQVYLNVTTGPTEYLASGILLGLPLNDTQIPDSLLSEFGFNKIRTGGSQLPAPSRGWTQGELAGRYESLKADWDTLQRHGGGTFQIMIHDMWGTDSWPSLDATPMPGDNGSYVDFDNFLDTLFALLIEDDIIDNVYWDMWNEVDNVDFLNRGLDRWLEYWGHATHKIWNEFPNAKVTGPSYGHLPNFAGDTIDWFTEWAQFIQQNQSIPDAMSLHFLYPNGDLELSITTWQDILSAAGVDYQGTWNVQEYGNPDQLYPSGAAWNIAQLERMNAPGLRANWMSGFQLHDFAANLLSKPLSGDSYVENATGYYPAREFPVYSYYRQKMQGTRVQTVMTNNTLSDAYAVICDSDSTLRVLSGTRPANGTWEIQINSLSSLGLPTSGSVQTRVIQFNSASTLFDSVDSPIDEGLATWYYGNDYIVWTIFQDDPELTWAFEISY